MMEVRPSYGGYASLHDSRGARDQPQISQTLPRLVPIEMGTFRAIRVGRQHRRVNACMVRRRSASALSSDQPPPISQLPPGLESSASPQKRGWRVTWVSADA